MVAGRDQGAQAGRFAFVRVQGINHIFTSTGDKSVGFPASWNKDVAAGLDAAPTTTHFDAPTVASPITDARLQGALDYWRRQSDGKAVARRADIDPTDIPKLLPHVMLVEVLPSGRYRYRLIGTENAEAHGMNATGRYLDEVLPGPEYKAHVLGLYDECVRSRRALYSECLFISPQLRAPERHTKVLFLPLSENGETVNQVFVVQVFFYIDPAMRQRHFIEARPFTEIAHVLL